MSESPRICIASGGDEIRLRSYVNHAIYAREHGLDYRLETGIGPRIVTAFDYKLSIIRRLLPLYDWLVWLDDDAYFTDFDADTIRELIRDASESRISVVVAEGPLEPNGFWSRINTGVLILRSDDIAWQIVDQTVRADLSEVRVWWDDDRDGLFTNGDQDQMWWVISTGGFKDRVRIVDHRILNSRGHYYAESLKDAFIMHFTGHPDKELGVARFADRWNVGQELVPGHLLDEYNVRVRSPLSGRGRKRREYRTDAISSIKFRLRPYKKQITTVVGLLPDSMQKRLPRHHR